MNSYEVCGNCEQGLLPRKSLAKEEWAPCFRVSGKAKIRKQPAPLINAQIHVANLWLLARPVANGGIPHPKGSLDLHSTVIVNCKQSHICIWVLHVM